MQSLPTNLTTGYYSPFTLSLRTQLSGFTLQSSGVCHSGHRPGSSALPTLQGHYHRQEETSPNHAHSKHQATPSLTPKWQTPYTVILPTPTAVELQGLPHWIHNSHISFVSPYSPPTKSPTGSYSTLMRPLTLCISRCSSPLPLTTEEISASTES